MVAFSLIRSGRGRDFGRRPLLILGAALVTATAGCSVPGAGLPRLPEMAPGPYRLGTGDTLRLTVFDEERLSMELRVADSGNIAIPLAGPIPVQGLTVEEASAAVQSALRSRGVLQNPQIALEVLVYRPIFVLGMVERGGQFPFQPGMSALTAVSLAGGFNYRAVTDRIGVVRSAGDGSAVEYVADRSSRLLPGDVVNIFERRF